MNTLTSVILIVVLFCAGQSAPPQCTGGGPFSVKFESFNEKQQNAIKEKVNDAKPDTPVLYFNQTKKDWRTKDTSDITHYFLKITTSTVHFGRLSGNDSYWRFFDVKETRFNTTAKWCKVNLTAVKN